jgi:putative transposase
MCLRFVYLLVISLLSWMRLARRSGAWKDAEILLLRHQLDVLQRKQVRRPRLRWSDRALIAALAGVIPKAQRAGLRLLVTPDTVVRWHRDLLRRRWAAKSRAGRSGRPATRRGIRRLVLRLAGENPDWGYRRIHGELAGLGVRIAPSTVWEILTKAGIEPAPRRTRPTWAQFLRSQAEAIIATDFFTIDLLNGAQVYCLAVIEHATRRIHILGATTNPTAAWVTQQARNLVMDLDGHAETIKFLIRDRDSKFVAAFDAVFHSLGIRIINTPVQAPRANAIMERWVGSCRREILDRTLVWNLLHLRCFLAEYEDHYNRHRPHRALQQASPLRGLPEPAIWTNSRSGGATASAASSTNIPRSHDVDEVVGTHRSR